MKIYYSGNPGHGPDVPPILVADIFVVPLSKQTFVPSEYTSLSKFEDP
jgi:hypothetical protein